MKKNIKFIYSIIVSAVVSIIINTTAYGSSPLFVIKPASTQNQTQAVSIPITLNNYNQLNIESIDLEINYDENVLNASDISITDTILENENYLFNYNVKNAGIIYVAFAASGSLYNGTGLLLNLEFDVIGTANESSDITLSKAWINDISYDVSSGSFTVAPNSPPTVANISPQTFDEDTTHSMIIIIDDIESNPCDLTLNLESSNPLLIATENISISGSCAQRTLFITPTTNISGSALLTVTISDGTDTSIYNIDLTISEVNDLPQIETISDQTIEEDTSLSSLEIIATDVDTASCSLNMAFKSSDTTLIPVENISYTCNEDIYYISMDPSADSNGNSVITVSISDAENLSASESFTLTVIPVNDMPAISSIADQSTIEDTPININFTSTDIESSPCSLNLSTISSNQTLLSNSNIISSCDTNVYTLSVSPELNQNGITTISIIVSDSEGLSNSTTFDLNVTAENDPPQFNNDIPDQEATEDVFYTFTLDINTFTDPDLSDTLIYTAKQSNGDTLPSWLTFESSNRTFSGEPANNDVGVITITVLAKDSMLETAAASFKLTVVNVNDAPVISTIISDQTATEDQNFNFAVNTNTFSDDDIIFGDMLTYTAKLDNNQALPSWLSFNPDTLIFDGTPDNADVAVYMIKVTATDSSYETVSDTFTLTVVNVNDAPVLSINIPDQYATEDALFNFTFSAGTFEDDDSIHGDTLSYLATQSDGSALPLWLTFNELTRTFNGTPSNDNVGTISIKVTASDSSNQTVTDTFTLTVQNVNNAPQISTIGDQSINEDNSSSEISFTISDSDTPADNLIVSGNSSDENLLTNSNIVFTGTGTSRFVQLTPEAEKFGTTNISIHVSDGSYTSTTTFELTVNSVNDTPVLDNPISDQSIDEDSSYAFTFNENTFSDVDVLTGDIISYNATLSNDDPLPSWLSFNSSTRTFSGLPLNEDVGTLSIKVIATDSLLLEATDSFELNINNTNDTPTLDIPISDQYARQDQSFSFTFNNNTFSDDDVLHGDYLTYNATLSDNSALPTWLTFNSSTRTFSGTPADSDVANLSIKVIATDTDNARATDIFTLFVEDINYAPVIGTIPDQTTDEINNTNPVDFSITDVDTEQISVNVVSNDQSLIPDSNISLINADDVYTISITPVTGQVGTTTITVSASDGISTTTQSFAITVQETYLTVSGHVAYNSFSGDSIEGVVMTLSGMNNYSSTTDSNGNYIITNVRPGDYVLTPSKTDDTGKLTLSDAIQILKSVAQLTHLNCHEKLAADVTQNGTNSAMDASKVARYVAGAESCLNNYCQLWTFMTSEIDSCDSWPPITYGMGVIPLTGLDSNVSGKDFIGIFLGDVVE